MEGSKCQVHNGAQEKPVTDELQFVTELLYGEIQE